LLTESLAHLFSFDFAWFVSLALDNILMAFMLFVVFFVFLEGQNTLKGCFVIFVAFFAFLDFEKVLGVTFFTGSFMLVYYISKLSILSLVEGSSSLKKHMIFINEIQFFVAVATAMIFFG